MQAINPSVANHKRDNGLRTAQSVQKVLNGGIAEATPLSTNAAGIYNTFAPDNGNGTTLRIGANGGSESYNWPSAPNTGLTIYHGLGRQPIGFRVHDIDGNANIYRTIAPDENQITLATTDQTVNATVYIF